MSDSQVPLEMAYVGPLMTPPAAPEQESTSSSITFVLLAALAITISYADRSNLSTAIIPMAQDLNWDNFFSGIVLSAFWGGYALTQVLGGALADIFGGEALLVVAMIVWSGATAFTPIGAAMGSFQILAVRVLLGAGEGLALPAIHSMIRVYVLPAQRSIAAAVVTAACYAGALVSNFVAPIIIDKWDWQTCFYWFASIPALLWLPMWGLFVWSSRSTRSRNESENLALDGINRMGKDEVAAKILPGLAVATERRPTLMQLLKQKPVWAIIAGQYGQSFGMIGLLSWLPTYYSARFNVPIASLGSFTVLPYFLQLLMALAAGVIADGLIGKGVRVLSVRKALQTVGMVVPAVCLAYCSYATELSATSAATFITLGSAFSSLTVGAVSCNHFDISPKNSGTIFAIGNTVGCIGGLVAVPLSGYIYDQTHTWSLVFGLFALHYLAGCILWNRWASDQPLIFDSAKEE